MATVHPSRLGLVPQDSRTLERIPSRSRSRTPDRKTRGSRRSSRERQDNRRSPEYEEYHQRSGPLPWRVEDNMYPPRGGRHLSGEWGNRDYLTSRQKQRESRTVNIWPSSPKFPVRELSPADGSKPSRRRARSPSTSSSESSSSDEERKRREKERRKRSKRREKEERREKRKRSNRHRRSEDSDDRRDSRKRSRERGRSSRSISRNHSLSVSDEDEWVEKKTPFNGFIPLPATTGIEVPHASVSVDDNDDDVEIGPQPMKALSTKVDERSYGGALLRGEGSAMAAFLAEDVNARIPRRGEIGLTSDEIASFESVGYVMSGSRHRRMNAVRMRKENQVISAEEKRGILKLQKEERERREEILREEFKELVDEKLKSAGSKFK